MLDVLLEQVRLVDIQILKEEQLLYLERLLLTQLVGRRQQQEGVLAPTNNLVVAIVALLEDLIRIILHHLLLEVRMVLQAVEAQALVLCLDLQVEVAEVHHQEVEDADNLYKKNKPMKPTYLKLLLSIHRNSNFEY